MNEFDQNHLLLADKLNFFENFNNTIDNFNNTIIFIKYLFGSPLTKFAVADKELTFMNVAITYMKYHCLSVVNCNLPVRLVT